MNCDNQVVVFLAKNLTYDEHTKHIEIDFQAIHHLVLEKFITTLQVGSSHQLVDILKKGLSMAS